MKAIVVAAAFAVGMAAAWGAAAAMPEAQAQAAGPAQDGDKPVLIMAAGGSAPNINDITWVLTTEVFEHPKTKKRVERKVLLCYKVSNGGKFIDIVDVRDITWDAKFEQLAKDGHDRGVSPEQMRKMWERLLKQMEKGDGD